MNTSESSAPAPATHFIHEIIEADLAAGRCQTVVTRFPPEPNGYLHIGHSKSICLNFGTALKYGGRCHLRFDDTNPVKEDTEYVEAIKANIHWLGFDWGEHEYYASDYFDPLYSYAEQLIEKGLAYVDSLSAEEIRAYRGTLKSPGQNSPYRDRSIDENLELFRAMKAGKFEDGAHLLRAKIDMASPNINLRDPALYRIRHAHHHRTGDKWCIYPMYDYAHSLSDAIEGITHSLCTLEFEDHRPLYDWCLEALGWPEPRPHQYEFARLNLSHIRPLMSKRYLVQMVQTGHVSGWDDPRMPTLSAFKRRGVTPAALRDMNERIGVAKSNSEVEYAMLEFCVREDLNKVAQRRMAVLDPLKVVITNYPEGQQENFEAENNPEDPSTGHRSLAFGREIYIERSDFMEEPPKKYFRLAPGQEVRLKHAYYITCQEVIKDAEGQVTELHCTYDPNSRGGWTEDGRKVRGTLHWASAAHACKAELRHYDHLLLGAPAADQLLESQLNPDSLTIVEALVEPALAAAQPGEHFQFLRQGYYVMDADSTPEKPVFNRTVGMVDSWAKQQKKN
ncbi:MAG: glutamine--tRNA ligase/YqeY domain fusion protein [Candidatus Sericytochromatia bacterium]|nr:glutamine--tRNA ligase/YqeY domain fusion protein [Candidatus Sericytochromatia bacterium]